MSDLCSSTCNCALTELMTAAWPKASEEDRQGVRDIAKKYHILSGTVCQNVASICSTLGYLSLFTVNTCEKVLPSPVSDHWDVFRLLVLQFFNIWTIWGLWESALRCHLSKIWLFHFTFHWDKNVSKNKSVWLDAGLSTLSLTWQSLAKTIYAKEHFYRDKPKVHCFSPVFQKPMQHRLVHCGVCWLTSMKTGIKQKRQLCCIYSVRFFDISF